MTTTRTAATVAIAAALVAAPVIGVASAAQAHDQALSVTCTQISLNLTNYPSGSTVGGIIDDVDLGTSTFGPSFSQSAPLDPAVPHTYTITVVSPDGVGNKKFTGKSDPACIPVVTTPPVVVLPTEEPTPPVVTPPVVDVVEPRIQDYVKCEGAAFVLDNTGSTVPVRYLVSGDVRHEYVVPAGQTIHTDADGTLINPGPSGYTITAGDKTWTFPTSDNCPTTPPTTTEPATPPVVVPPTDEPTEQPSEPVTPPTSSPEPEGTTPGSSEPTPNIPQPSSPVERSVSPSVVPSGSGSVPTASPDEQRADALAFTGARDMTAWIAVAAVAIAAGAAAIMVPILRRRAAQGQ